MVKFARTPEYLSLNNFIKIKKERAIYFGYARKMSSTKLIYQHEIEIQCLNWMIGSYATETNSDQ